MSESPESDKLSKGWKTGRHLVMFTDDTTCGDIENKLERLCKVLWAPKDVENCFEDLKCFVGKFDDKSLEILRSNLNGPSKDRIVELIHEEYIFPARSFLQSLQEHGGTGGSIFKSFLDPNGVGKGVDIYIIDSGVSIGHDDFGGCASWTNFENTNTFYGAPLVKSDFNGHGTHVVGIAAGKKYGVAKAARIIAIKVLGTAPWMYDFPAEMASSSLIVRGMRKVSQLARATWQDSRRHSVLNLSIDLPHPGDYAEYAQSLHQMIGSVTNAGVHVVIAKGNENRNIQYTNTTDAIHVSASTIEDRRWVDSWGSSDYGRGVDLFAPGASIYSASNKDAQLSVCMSGSSMATPNVAGIIACLISADDRNRLTPREMKQKVLDLAERDGMDRMRLDERALITGTTTRLASLVLVPR